MIRLKNRDRIFRVRCIEPAIAELHNHLHHHRAQRFAVIDDQDRLALPLGRRSRNEIARLRCVKLPARQIELDAGALPDIAMDAYVAAGLLGEPVGHRQTEPGALAKWFSG